jgi:hypothetical protein
MTDIATNEPREARAGLTWEWERELSDYPAGTWTLKYWFKQLAAVGARFSITATASGTKHAISVAAATTVAYTAGDYSWSAVVTAGSQAFEVDRGVLKLLPRYDADAALDDRSHARTVLDAIEAVIENRATKDQEEYSIAGRSLTRTPIAELLALRDKYKAEVQRETLEENARNGIQGGKLVVRL